MIFVTGGTGLVGSHILLKLSQGNIPFKALKRNNSSLDVCKDIFIYYESEHLFKSIIWETGDVNDIPSLENAMKDCDKIIHAAAMVSFHKEDAELMNKINVEGTKNIMNVAISIGIKKVSYISSISALGRNNIEKEIIDEECFFKISKKENNYSLSKYFSEQEVWRASQEGVDVVISNPSIILGPGDWNKGSSQIFQKIYNGLKFYTTGSTGYVDVVDVANCAILLLQSDIKNERFIINGENLKYRDVFNWIADGFGKKRASIKVTPFLKEIAWRTEYILSIIIGKKALITKESAESAMKNSRYSTKKIEKAIHYQFTPIKDSILKYCNWFLKRSIQ
ncbi:MAG: hypothetical protein CMD02_07015 [Flavobacteriales bacterium]|nr:hypothetical protein [Flavobacteriales bacterium]|tara:strand:- start:476 stop:1486 length:1011 start_codon:yes stop_codon:yes gene_type:complete